MGNEKQQFDLLALRLGRYNGTKVNWRCFGGRGKELVLVLVLVLKVLNYMYYCDPKR